MKASPLCLWLFLPMLALAAGAGDKPEVEVVEPVAREVSDYEDFTGRTEASATVVLKARVTGYLDKIHFKDGAEVKKGDLLFEIDPRLYKAELEKAEAEVGVIQAVLARTEAEYKLAKALLKRKAITKDELDKIEAMRDEPRARLRAAKAVRELAQLNLDYTKVTAPISGRIGRRRLDPGNLVKADETDLSTLVQTTPIYVYFEIDERTALRPRLAKGKGLQVAIGLADEKGFPQRAEVDFVANHMDPKTGTLRLRAPLPNADGLLKPGMFVRVRLSTGKPYKAMLVPDRAVVRKLANILFVVNQKNEVEVRNVRLGQRHGDLVVVKEGLQKDDRVVLKGPKGMKEGMTVRPKKVAPEGK
jgi:RND family efflux transporter MFP subunit